MKNSKLIMQYGLSLLAFGLFMLLGSHPAEATSISQVAMGSGASYAMAFGVGAIDWEDGSENMGGLNSRLFFVPISQIATEAKLPTTPTTDEQKCVITDTHLLAAGKYWREIYATEGTIKLEPENQGEFDAQSFKNKGEYFHPGSKTAAIAFARDVNNTPGIYIFMDGDKRYQVGTVARPAHTKPSWASGEKGADRKGFKFMVEADSPGILTEYRGAIALSETETLPAES